MPTGKLIFSQITEWIHPEQFRRCVQRYEGNYRVRTFPCWDQFLAMAFAQLTYRDSLTDIEVCLRSLPEQLYHMGFCSTRVKVRRAGRSHHTYPTVKDSSNRQRKMAIKMVSN